MQTINKNRGKLSTQRLGEIRSYGPYPLSTVDLSMATLTAFGKISIISNKGFQ